MAHKNMHYSSFEREVDDNENLNSQMEIKEKNEREIINEKKTKEDNNKKDENNYIKNKEDVDLISEKEKLNIQDNLFVKNLFNNNEKTIGFHNGQLIAEKEIILDNFYDNSKYNYYELFNSSFFKNNPSYRNTNINDEINNKSQDENKSIFSEEKNKNEIINPQSQINFQFKEIDDYSLVNIIPYSYDYKNIYMFNNYLFRPFTS